MIEDLENIELNSLPVYDDKYIKSKIRTYGDKDCTNFHGLNVPENEKKKKKNLLQSFLFIMYLYTTTNIYLQIYLDNCVYKTVNKQMTDYLDGNKIRYYKCCITIELKQAKELILLKVITAKTV